MSFITIAIDTAGGDFGPSVTVPASLLFLQKYPTTRLILVGKEETIIPYLQKRFDRHRLEIVNATQTVEMNESPAHALRTKKDSSMRVAINLVKMGKADACVSAGNTGALMATARFVLKTLPLIDRPAIVSAFPTYVAGKPMRMLDLGANVDSTAEHLFQFAVMGSVLTAALDNLKNPRVALLNIGEEEIKGNEQVKHTASLLSRCQSINYVGYVEGDAIYKGEVDVVVCDGFVGNVTLKTTEGVARFVGLLIKEAFMRNKLTQLTGLMVKPVLKEFVKRIDPTQYNGATLIGLKGTVVKSHGSTSIKGFAKAIEEAMLGVQKNIPQRITHEVERVLKQTPTNSSGE